MGAGCCNEIRFIDVLKRTLLTNLIPGMEWDGFEKICKYEHFNLSHRLKLSKSVAFYVVITGEVVAALYSPKVSEQTGVRVYGSGDVIHMFGGSLISNDGYLVNGDVKITFITKTVGLPCSIVSIPKDKLTGLLITRPALATLKAFSNLTVGNLLTRVPLIDGHTPKQWELLGPLLRLQAVYEADDLFGSTGLGAKFHNGELRQTIDVGGMILMGKCVALRSELDTEVFQQMMRTRSVALQQHTVAQQMHKQQHGPGPELKCPVAPLEFGEFGEVIRSGSFFGLGHYFVANPMPKTQLSNVVVCQASIVGLFSADLLDCLKPTYIRILRELKAQFHYSSLKAVRNTVPFLSESVMNDTDLRWLALRTGLHKFQSGSLVYKNDQVGGRMYVVLVGQVQEMFSESKISIEANLLRASWCCTGVVGTFPNSAVTMLEGEIVLLTPGQYFGLVPIATETNYLGTVTALKPTMLLSINKSSFHTLYDRAKSDLCETKARMLGPNMDMTNVVEHIKGYTMVLQYFERCYASENLLFWHAAERITQMCHVLTLNSRVELGPLPGELDNNNNDDAINENDNNYDVAALKISANNMEEEDLNSMDSPQNNTLLNQKPAHLNENIRNDSGPDKWAGNGSGNNNNNNNNNNSDEDVSPRRHTTVTQSSGSNTFRGVKISPMDNEEDPSGEVTHFAANAVPFQPNSSPWLASLPINEYAETGATNVSRRVKKNNSGPKSVNSNNSGLKPGEVRASCIVDSNLRDLHRVITQIMQTFILPRSFREINISSSLRTHTEHLYVQWSTLVYQHFSQRSAVLSRRQHLQALESIYGLASEILELPSKDIFRMMGGDLFQRIRKSADFKGFLTDVVVKEKPQDNLSFSTTMRSTR